MKWKPLNTVHPLFLLNCVGIALGSHQINLRGHKNKFIDTAIAEVNFSQPTKDIYLLQAGFFANFIGIVCFFAGMKRVGPSTASIVMNLEPVLTVVLSVLLLAESFSWGQALGGGGILLGLYLLQRKESSI